MRHQPRIWQLFVVIIGLAIAACDRQKIDSPIPYSKGNSTSTDMLASDALPSNDTASKANSSTGVATSTSTATGTATATGTSNTALAALNNLFAGSGGQPVTQAQLITLAQTPQGQLAITQALSTPQAKTILKSYGLGGMSPEALLKLMTNPSYAPIVDKVLAAVAASGIANSTATGTAVTVTTQGNNGFVNAQ